MVARDDMAMHHWFYGDNSLPVFSADDSTPPDGQSCCWNTRKPQHGPCGFHTFVLRSGSVFFGRWMAFRQSAMTFLCCSLCNIQERPWPQGWRFRNPQGICPLATTLTVMSNSTPPQSHHPCRPDFLPFPPCSSNR